jgi:putative drug exporter of the RND superfamily
MRRPCRAVALWVAFVIACVAIGVVTGTRSLGNGAVGESGRGNALADAHGVWPPQSDYGYVHSAVRTAGDPAFRSAVADVRRRMHAVLGAEVQVRVSRNRHSVLLAASATRDFKGPFRDTLAAAARAHPQLTIGGDGPGSGGSSGSSDLRRAEELALPVTLLVLLIAFGALVAAVVPVALALTAVVAAFGLLGPISRAAPLDDSVKTIVLLIGMAVGVDYALFYVIRSREERLRGRSSRDALEITARTSGHTVVLAGTTVAIAMAGQYAMGSQLFDGVASGTIAVVACAVAGSVTVLPAVLELVGPRIDRGRIRFLPQLRVDGQGRFWPAVVDRVMRRPLVSLLLAAGLLVALAVPALGLHVSEPTSDVLRPRTDPLLVSGLNADFPGTSAPAVLVLTYPPADQVRVRRAVQRLERLATARGLAHPPFAADTSADGTAAAIALPLTGNGANAQSRRAIRVLRRDLIPETVGRVPGVGTAVAGPIAEDVDFTHHVERDMPYVVGFVLALAFLLLLISFRSLVVPLKAIVLNLLSVAAAYGVLVLVFQHHWAEGLLGFHSNGSIIAWLPLFLFVVLFGLSMDYHVFILRRVREGVDAGMGNEDAVRYGITRTAGVVTSAALVMVGVFSIFGTLGQLDVKQAGVGLAAAVLIDATIVRGVLLPASMTLLGDWNWYLPSFLQLRPRTLAADIRPISTEEGT